MTRCRESAYAEPLAGTAPLARWWWLIEVPGAWGNKALEECRVPVVRQLESSPERRVLLVRRRGRHPAAEKFAPLRVWIAGAMPGDPAPRVVVVDSHEQLLTWPASGPPGDLAREDPHAPVLTICTNASRDLCCGIDGRALIADLDDDRVWECSHLGGHRLAPTALLVRQGLVYGRLDTHAARDLVDRGPTSATAGFLRGRSALPPAAQAAEAYLMSQGHCPDARTAQVHESAPDRAHVAFDRDLSVDLHRVTGEPRPASCGKDPEAWSAWSVEGTD